MCQPPCLNKALSGDRGALEELAGICYPVVFGYLAGRTGSREQARDLAQDVMLRVLESLHTYRPRPGVSFMAWVFRIARNRYLDAVRGRYDALPLPEDGEYIPDASHDSTGNAALANMDAETLRRALAELPPGDRELLELRYFHGFSHRDTAGILGVGPPVVKSRLNAALGRLRKRYRAMEGDGIDA